MSRKSRVTITILVLALAIAALVIGMSGGGARSGEISEQLNASKPRLVFFHAPW
ncbi:MAG: hypothetical protein M1548_04535 [Actinobacteria bacterium]|nr:hypothetical protein [Actinomycetota bacterium]